MSTIEEACGAFEAVGKVIYAEVGGQPQCVRLGLHRTGAGLSQMFVCVELSRDEMRFTKRKAHGKSVGFLSFLEKTNGRFYSKYMDGGFEVDPAIVYHLGGTS